MEIRKSVDQKRVVVRRFVQRHRNVLRRQGSVAETYRLHNGRRLGPYYSLTFRDDGRQRSLYLGADSEIAAEVRAELARLQAGQRQRRQLNRAKRTLRRELVRQRAVFRRELRRVGLHLKGAEVRGWRALRGEGMSE